MIQIGLARRSASIFLAVATALSMTMLATPEASAATGCQTFSMSNQNYNSTSYEYANRWTITPTHPGMYHWYLRRLSDDGIVQNGSSSGDFGDTFGATTYRMQIQNLSGAANTYTVCYTVV